MSTFRKTAIALAIVSMVGCEGNPAKEDGAAANEAQPVNQTLTKAEADLLVAQAREEERKKYEAELAAQNEEKTAKSQQDDMLPPRANAGECYARVVSPAQYEQRSEQVVIQEEGKEVSVIPATYRVETKQVMVSPEQKIVEKIIPAQYETYEDKVLVKEATKKLVRKEAEFQTIEEKILVKPEYEVWKKGTGPIQKIDESTGEIMCLVKIPAEYKTYTRQELVKPERIEEVEIPAVYKMVKKQRLVKDKEVVYKTIPAVYKTVEVEVVDKPAQKTETIIPAKYQTLTKMEKVTDSKVEWREILCETNFNKDLVTDLQIALRDKGYLKPVASDKVIIDGIIGDNTMNAVTAYQKDNNLSYGQLTMEVLKHLNVVN